MTREEFNFIKDSFSQIIDDIAGNPNWYDAAKAIASDLGTLEKQLEKDVIDLPSNIDEAAEEYSNSMGLKDFDKVRTISDFKFGVEWIIGQGYTKEGIARPDDCEIWVNFTDTDIKDGDEVIVQIRKK